MNTTTNTDGIAKHINLSDRYGCRAWMAVASFTAHDVKHVARRFYREDMIETGIRTAAIAAFALDEVDSVIASDQATRFAGIELR